MINLNTIDTRFGTNNHPDFSHGNALPLTGVPFAMNYLAVQTTLEDTAWWFNPGARTFAGIRITHQPSPWIGDFQHFAFMPLTSTPAGAPNMAGSFRPEDSTFAPHYLHVHEIGEDVDITATSSMYGGSLQLRSHADIRLRLLTPDRSSIASVHGNVLVLQTQNFSDCEDPDFSMYTAIALPQDAATSDVTVGAIAGDHVEVALNTTEACVRFATSFISPDQALANLTPLLDYTFAEQLTANAAKWQERLDRINVTDHHAQRVSTFYHNFYRAMLFPMRFYEEDAAGQPIHYNTTARTVASGKLFTGNGFWDTYKTAFPFYSLLFPNDYAEFLQGFMVSYTETGFLPRWLSPDERGMMPGTMVDAVIADAAVKGIATDMMPAFLKAMIHGAETISDDPKYGREGLAEYLELGYVPCDIHESVNKTLDYAYSDWLISVVAGTLNEKDIQAKYAKRSRNWRNVFDANAKLMHPKDRDGKFTADFDDTTWGNGFTEGSAWQNSFAVYEDIPGLIDACGGKQDFTRQLHKLVNQPATFKVGSYGGTIHEMREMAALDFGQLAISNQPSFHLPYLFALAGDSAGTQLTVKQLVNTAFNDGVDGYPGDEDNGSMASWYLFSTLGFYPVTPGSGEYVLGMPMFDDVQISLANGHQLHLTTNKNHDYLNFVGRRTLNGTQLGSTVSHAELLAGGTLAASLQLLPDVQ